MQTWQDKGFHKEKIDNEIKDLLNKIQAFSIAQVVKGKIH